MLLDRERDLGLLAGGLGVVAAHHALQVGELDDRVGDEVGLGQMGGTRGVRGFVGGGRERSRRGDS